MTLFYQRAKDAGVDLEMSDEEEEGDEGDEEP